MTNETFYDEGKKLVGYKCLNTGIIFVPQPREIEFCFSTNYKFG